MSDETTQTPEQQPVTQQPDLAAELASLKKQAEEAQKQARESKEYVENLQKAAIGEKPEAPKNPNDVFVDHLLTNGPNTVASLVDQKLNERAYFDSLRSKFEKDHPNLEPVKDYVFGMANQIVANNAQQGRQVTFEAAIQTAADDWKERTSRLQKIEGAGNSPLGFGGGPVAQKFNDSFVDGMYDNMSDEEFVKNVMNPRDNERRDQQRKVLNRQSFGR